MNHWDLLNALDGLLAAQFNMLVYHLGAPPAVLPGENAAQATRAIAVIHWAEQQGRLTDVESLLHWVRTQRPQEPGAQSREAKARIYLSRLPYNEVGSKPHTCTECEYTGPMHEPKMKFDEDEHPLGVGLAHLFRWFIEVGDGRTVICPSCTYRFRVPLYE
jgi:hypothetical protein